MLKKVEVLANVVVIVTSLLLCSVVAKKYLLSNNSAGKTASADKSASAQAPVRPKIQPGTALTLPGVDWSKSERTLVLAVSTTCHFCTESAPFYQQLQKAKPNNLRLIAALPQPTDEGRRYLTKLDVNLSEIVQVPLASIGVSGTPTLILVNDKGVVTESWVGKLPDVEAQKGIS